MSVALILQGSLRKILPAICLFAVSAMAQQSGAQSQTQFPSAPAPKLPSPTHVDYSKPANYWPNPAAPYLERTVPPPTFGNAPRIDELIKNGKLYLSMNDAIALALADNLDIAIARFNLPIADTDILLTKSGGSPRGVNTGVVQGTPGGAGTGVAGGTGGGAGGTSTGAGGAGAGASGIVLSATGAGPTPDSFDPVVSGTLSFERSKFPLSNIVTTGTNNLSQNTTTGNFTYFQGFSPGTSLTFTYDNNRQTTNSLFTTLNPVLNSSFRATIRQHLLQGFGPSINTRLIRQAKNTKKITEESFRQQVIVTVGQIQNLYWDLVNAYEDVRVKERSLGLAQKTLSDNRKQVEIGTLAPIDIVRAQSTVSTAEQDLLVSRTNLQLQQLQMKNAITRSLPSNSPVTQAEVVPTDTVQIPDQENLPGVDDLMKQALVNRPDYIEQKINLENSAIGLKGAKNGLLPIVDLVGFYGAAGLAGVQNPAFKGLPPGSIPTTGFFDADGNLFNSSSPDKGVAINITVPIRNRAAQSVQIRAQLEYRQAELHVKQLENQIAIQIRNDTFAVQQNRARVAAARQAQELAAQTLDAEQKKYALGASTYILILQDQRDLAQAESNTVAAMTNYAKSRVTLDQDTAELLDRNNIKLDEAVTGDVKTIPSVPGAVPNTGVQENQTAPPATPPPSR
jgi:outer membrane protein